jgi:hypothetical protein
VRRSDTDASRLSGNRIGYEEGFWSKSDLRKYCEDQKVAASLAGLGDLTESEIAQAYFLPAFFAAQ